MKARDPRWLAAVIAVLWLGPGCPGDPAKPEAARDWSWQRVDRQPDRLVPADRAGPEANERFWCKDSVAFNCGDSRFWCDFGTCRLCAANQLNCNGIASCECATNCEGQTCRGIARCDYYEQNVCDGDPTKFCFQGQCISCTGGWQNCDGTKGCECEKGCNGKLCL